jgi:hypothetical protein
MNESVIDRLQAVHPDLEVWWDSSPLVFKPVKMVARPLVKSRLEEQLNRIFVVEDRPEPDPQLLQSAAVPDRVKSDPKPGIPGSTT